MCESDVLRVCRKARRHVGMPAKNKHPSPGVGKGHGGYPGMLLAGAGEFFGSAKNLIHWFGDMFNLLISTKSFMTSINSIKIHLFLIMVWVVTSTFLDVRWHQNSDIKKHVQGALWTSKVEMLISRHIKRK
jgi:hypothetical protein